MERLATDQKVFQDVIEFAKKIGMVAFPLYKEQPGYILNALLVPFLEAAQLLLVNQLADIETIDKTWMIATGAPEGPFAILDAIGINNAFNIVDAKSTCNKESGVCEPGKSPQDKIPGKGQAWQSHGARLLHLS